MEAKLPFPTFEFDGYFVVCLYKNSSAKGIIEGGIEGGINITGILKVPDKQKEVLELIRKNNRISIDEVAKKLDINRSAAQKHFEGLKGKNIIVRRGHRSGYWEILS